jgi:hypothetical protein
MGLWFVYGRRCGLFAPAPYFSEDLSDLYVVMGKNDQLSALLICDKRAKKIFQ